MNREEKSKISREKILQASLKEFGENDYNLASINNICKHNDITKGLLFHYYKSKDDLFLLCVENLFLDLSVFLKEHDDYLKNNFYDDFESFVQRRFAFFEKYPYYRQIFFTCIFNTPKHLKLQIQDLRKPVVELNRAFWLNALRNMKIKSNIDLDECVDMIIGIEEYVHSKMQINELSDKEGDVLIAEKYTKEFSKIMEMLLYGIIEK